MDHLVEIGEEGSPGRVARFEELLPNLLSACSLARRQQRLPGRWLRAFSTSRCVRLAHWAGCEVCSIYSGRLFARVALLRPHGSGETEATVEKEGKQQGTAGRRLQLRPGPAPAVTLQQKPQHLSAVVSHLPSSTASCCCHCHSDSHHSRFSLAHRLRLWGEVGGRGRGLSLPFWGVP